MDEHVAATRLAEVLERFDGTPTIRRLVIRVRELGDNVLDEVSQLRPLQKACREDAALAAALGAAGFGDVAALDTRHLTEQGGAVVQAFNRLIEERQGPFSR